MAVGLLGLPKMHAVRGIRLGTTSAGIRRAGRRDLVVIECSDDTQAAAVFTLNRFCAPPVMLARAHLAAHRPRALLINTGCANAGTGEQGRKDALASCDALAAALQCQREQILPFSTGVIGERLPVDRLVAGLSGCLGGLTEDGWIDAAQGIMTTDTVAKGSSRRIEIDGETVTITGMAKGAGMIRPDMATMLAFIATDARISGVALEHCLRDAVNLSFNRITVDGDTSTNDACVLLATQQANHAAITQPEGRAYAALAAAVHAVFIELAQAIVRDAEGATKFITIDVVGGASEKDCLEVAYTIAHSPLVKTAFFASDPNWGRILAAIGRAALSDLNIEKVSVFLGDVCIVRGGARAAEYQEEQGQAVMAQPEITIRADLGAGNAQARIWTCDFSYDYVRINAEYRT